MPNPKYKHIQPVINNDSKEISIPVSSLRPSIVQMERARASLEILAEGCDDDRLGLALDGLADTFCQSLSKIHDLMQ